MSKKIFFFLSLLIFLSVGLSAEDNSIKLMTFNIRYGTAFDGENAWPLRKDLLIETIRDFSPGILGVQEALRFQLKEIDRAFPTYTFVGVGRDDGKETGEHTAVFFDTTRFSLLGENTFWFSDKPEKPGSISWSWGNLITRACTWVNLMDKKTEMEFYVYNLHWDHIAQTSREKSAVLLLKKIKTLSNKCPNFIVIGDFNAGENNPAFQKLITDSVVVMKDSFREIFPDAKQVGTFNDFEGRDDGDKIDAILISSSFETVTAEIVHKNENGRYPSDHFPVTAILKIKK